ncbi:MAG: protein kinase [Bradymonadaceae bacterium]|nr:protein kinase [Lujinxingiaceae bacterium]
MSEPTDQSPGVRRPTNMPGPPPPKMGVRAQAPGVRSSRQAPQQEVTLRTGDNVGGRFFVERYLGSSGGGISYLCNDKQTQEPVVVKVLDMPFPGQEVFGVQSEKVRIASTIVHRNLTRLVGMGRAGGGEIFIAMEFVEGSTLSQLVAQRRNEGRTMSIRDTFTVLAHVCNALSVVHKQLAHGVLTPYNVYVNRQGVVKVGNLAFGQMVSEFMHAQGEGPFIDSIYVAPEVSVDPSKLSPRSDIYSLGMIAAELLSPLGLPNDRKQAHDMAVDGLSKYPPSLFTLISQAISTDPTQRPASAAEFRDSFEDIAREVGAKLHGSPPPGALPIEPAVEGEDSEASEDKADDLFDDIFALTGVEGSSGPSDDRFLVQKGGLDYGPFTEEQLIEQLHGDEIDEHSMVLDRITQGRSSFGEMTQFRQIALDYIPVREERKRREAAARAELQRKVKKGGKAALVVGIVAGLVALGAMVWFWFQQPEPEKLPLESAFASLGYNFLPPPQDFQAVAVDNAILQSIFNPRASEEEIAQQIKRVRSRRSSASKAPRPGGGGGSDSDSGVASVDMGAGGSDHHLSDNEIYDIVISQMGHLRSCMMMELKDNRSFKGVTVQFFIRPSGTTGGVQLKEDRYSNRPVGECLIQRFRAIKFPEHGAISNRGVTFPFYIQ